MGLGVNVALVRRGDCRSEGSVFADAHVNMGIGAGNGDQLI
jgi:hypothetical protein